MLFLITFNRCQVSSGARTSIPKLRGDKIEVTDSECHDRTACPFTAASRTGTTVQSTVLEAAVNGQADAIVTFTIRDFDLVAADFGIEVLAPDETWQRLKAR